MERSLDSRFQGDAKNSAFSSTRREVLPTPYAPASSCVSQFSDLTPLVVPKSISSQCVEQFAIPLPDTEWRRTFRRSYERYKEIREEVKNFEVSLTSPYQPDPGQRLLSRQEITERVEQYKASLMDSWRKEHVPLHSGGTQVVDGEQVLKSAGQMWRMMDSASYCFLCLRRENLIDFSNGGAVGLLVGAGYYPVMQPEDFDIVVYGEVVNEPDGKDLRLHQLGMWKDGLVISKETRSIDVYHHPVEESAAHASHVMFFRHSKYPYPADGPTWSDKNRFKLFDPGIPDCLRELPSHALSRGSERLGIFSTLSSWLHEAKMYLKRLISRAPRN